MKFGKIPRRERLLIGGGLLMTTLPRLFHDFSLMHESVIDFLVGFGLVMEIFGLVRLMKIRKSEGVC